ncbi:BREX system ATP-binding domain-containing protein [Streptomyces sp. H27-D2]|uniref:BREX system ATP-binding domain-containing protein n=1 Tax=Streptomyces sp. H27-D2 TaxID=3046304 RepID=UPI002DB793D8|nr:BREX system ATP-binding domain-containing protein [Streptomyces sp. H27-D2]MEC4020835.1 BREX system ATP-binding domain-containing protein [Streptomyces sp. H27-D2]
MVPRELYGRSEESQIIAKMLDSATAGTGASALVEGIIGTGKTSLLRWAEEMARQRGMLVLAATASPTERHFSMGVVHQLLDCLEREGHHLGLSSQELPQRDDHAYPDYLQLADLFASLSRVAQSTPLLITVDCIQCTDPQSLLWLGFLSRRLDNLAVVLLASKRRGEPASDQHLLAEFMEGIRPDRHISIHDLSPSATSDLVAALGGPVPGHIDTLIAGSGGNPYLLTEQILAIPAPNTSAASQEHRGAHQSAELPIRLRAVKDRILSFLGRLDRHGLHVARAASVVGTAVTAELVAELCSLPVEEASECLDRLTESGLLRGTDLTFRHPVLARLLYLDIPHAERAELRRLTARCLHRRGDSKEEITPHLLQASQLDEPWMARLLLDAAEELLPQHADAAMDLIDKILLHGIPEHLIVRTEKLRVQALMGLDLPASLRAQSALADLTVGLRERAEESLRLADILLHLDEPFEARQVLEHAYHQVRWSDEAAAAQLRRQLTHARLHDGTYTLFEPRLDNRAAASGHASMGEERLESLLLLRTAMGDSATAVQRIAHTILSTPRAPYGSPPWYYALLGLLWSGHFGEALRHIDAEVQIACAEGAVTRVAEALAIRSLIQLHRGLLETADDDARQALTLLQRISADRHHVGALARSVLINVALEKNQVAKVADLLSSALPFPNPSVTWWQLHLMHSAARALGRLGETQRALGLITHCEKELRRWKVTNPAILPWRSTRAILQAGVGNLPDARRLAREEVELAQRWSAPFALGRALLTLASVTSGSDALRHSKKALELLDSEEAPLLFARSLYVAGQAHQQGGNAIRARELLHRANELGISLGADGLVEVVQRALRNAGGRPDPRKTSTESLLTPTERQVAEHASRGMSNPSIARLLQVSLRNVESHLTHSYRKLRISGRHELTKFFPAEEAPPSPVILHGREAVSHLWQPRSA